MTSPVKPADITRALRQLYPHAPITTVHAAQQSYTVTMPATAARYWGAGRDDAYAAAWLSWHLRRACRVEAVSETRAGSGPLTATVAVHLTGGPLPPDPGGSAGAPAYGTPEQALRRLTATRTTASLIHLAIKGGLRPHVDPSGPENGCYCMLLSYPSPDGLFGGIWVSEATGTAVRGTFCWGNHAPAQRERGVAAIRRHLTSWLALHPQDARHG